METDLEMDWAFCTGSGDEVQKSWWKKKVKLDVFLYKIKSCSSVEVLRSILLPLEMIDDLYSDFV